MNKSWLVLQSKPKKEAQVYRELCENLIEAYYPTISVKPANPRASKIRPFFPRYLFVYLDVDTAAVRTLRWTPGTIGVVQFGDEFATVPDNFIDELRLRLQRIEASGGLLFDDLEKGDPVRIMRGAFQGYEAIFDTRLSGVERVQLLLNMAGRSVKVNVDSSSIEKLKS